jgi:hypothetical protein
MNILHSMDLTWVHGARSMRLMHTEWIPTLIEFRHCMSMVLDHVVATNLTVIQKNLWDPVKRRALVFNRPMEAGDATWQVLREFEVLLDQSRRSVGSYSWRRWSTQKVICCSYVPMVCTLQFTACRPGWQHQHWVETWAWDPPLTWFFLTRNSEW